MTASGVSTKSISTPAKTLPVTQADQTKGYYCGPAAAFQLLKYLHPSASAYNGASLSQGTLGNSTYLKTDASGGTPWANGRMSVTLNRWTGQAWYVNTPSPSVTYFETDVWVDIYSGEPLVADAVELAGSYHYNNHPSNRTIGHWITAYGYTANVVSTKFADPAHSSAVSWGSLPAEYFSYGTSSFATRFLQNNGITW